MENLLMPEESFKDLESATVWAEGRDVVAGKGYKFYPSDTSDWNHRIWLECLDERTISSIIEGISRHEPRIVSYTEERMPDQVQNVLHDCGYELTQYQTGMIYPLQKEAAFFEENDPSVEEISVQELEEWCAVGADAFPKPTLFPAMQVLMDAGKETCMFLVYKDRGKMVGTTMIHMGHPMAGIHEVAVLSAYRGKQIAQKLVKEALRRCKRAGCEQAVLQASAAGKFVYEKLGFERTSTIKIWRCHA